MLATKKKALASQFQGAAISAGSFTVVNEKNWGTENVPLANSLFPELTRAVFELEEEITREVNPPLPSADGIDRQESNSIRRQSSTHCAVNRNAQFTPHVDTGRGSGQSVSMIVGLGNYTGVSSKGGGYSFFLPQQTISNQSSLLKSLPNYIRVKS